jgi:hypothetical protein
MTPSKIYFVIMINIMKMSILTFDVAKLIVIPLRTMTPCAMSIILRISRLFIAQYNGIRRQRII